MKLITGSLLLLIGILLILISIMGLIKAFDVFSGMNSSGESFGYAFGSILFPLLLTVIGRWIFRKGMAQLRGPGPNKRS